MSPEDMIPHEDSCSANVAAYALGALGPDEARAFERHLESCAVCPIELVAFQQVVDGIAASAPRVDAPRSLRRRVLRNVAAEPAAASAFEPARPRERSRRRSLHIPFGFAGAAFGTGVAFAVAAIIVVVIALPGRMGNRTIAANVSGAGTASLQITGGHAQIVVHDFAAPPRGKIYEVWLQRGTHDSPTNVLFSVNHDGNASVTVPGSLYGVSHVLVTPEPAPGGSQQPTHAPVISATI